MPARRSRPVYASYEMPTVAPTILMIDDNSGDVELLRETFAEIGVEVTIAHIEDGGGGLAMLRAIAEGKAPRPRLLVLDLNLPKLGGRDLLRFVRADPALAGLTTLMFSSSAREEDIAGCRADGADDYLVKPPSLDGLEVVVRRIAGFLPP